MSLSGGFGEVQLMPGVPFHRFADGANVITQVAVFLQAIPHDDRRRLYGDEPFFYKVIRLYSPSPYALRSVSKEVRREQYDMVFKLE